MEERLLALLRLLLKYFGTEINIKNNDISKETTIDIRIDGENKRVKVKYGDEKLIRYLMYLANLNVAEIYKPQTGTFELEVDGSLMTLRLAVIHTSDETIAKLVTVDSVSCTQNAKSKSTKYFDPESSDTKYIDSNTKDLFEQLFVRLANDKDDAGNSIIVCYDGNGELWSPKQLKGMLISIIQPQQIIEEKDKTYRKFLISCAKAFVKQNLNADFSDKDIMSVVKSMGV